MILYCDYCGAVYGAEVETAPDRSFCSDDCQRDFGSGPTLPPSTEADWARAEEEQRGEDAHEYAADAECLEVS